MRRTYESCIASAKLFDTKAAKARKDTSNICVSAFLSTRIDYAKLICVDKDDFPFFVI